MVNEGWVKTKRACRNRYYFTNARLSIVAWRHGGLLKGFNPMVWYNND